MAFLLDDFVANVFSTISSIWSMLPSVVQLFIGVALVGLMLGVFQAALFTAANNPVYEIPAAKNIRAMLTIGRACDNETGMCSITYQPYWLSQNMSYEFQRIDKNSSELQEQMDACVAGIKEAMASQPDNPLASQLIYASFTCDCNASSYNFTGYPRNQITCTGIPDGAVWTDCQQVGLFCMEEITASVYDAREEEIESGFYLLDAQFWFLVGMLAPAGKFAMDWYSASKAMG